MTTATATTLMERLKAETAEHHARAEGKTLQRELVQGRITRERYCAWLAQMFLVHDTLERGAARAPAHALIALVRRVESHASCLKDDLAAFDTIGPPRPLASTGRLVEAIDKAAADPASLFGMFYVLEGSMNGNKFIAMAVRKCLGLTPGRGDCYLDPYGDQQRSIWARFKGEAEAIGAETAEIDRAVVGAKAMFDGIAELSEELVVAV